MLVVVVEVATLVVVLLEVATPVMVLEVAMLDEEVDDEDGEDSAAFWLSSAKPRFLNSSGAMRLLKWWWRYQRSLSFSQFFDSHALLRVPAHIASRSVRTTRYSTTR